MRKLLIALVTTATMAVALTVRVTQVDGGSLCTEEVEEAYTVTQYRYEHQIAKRSPGGGVAFWAQSGEPRPPGEEGSAPCDANYTWALADAKLLTGLPLDWSDKRFDVTNRPPNGHWVLNEVQVIFGKRYRYVEFTREDVRTRTINRAVPCQPNGGQALK